MPKPKPFKKEIFHALEAPMPGTILNVLCKPGQYIVKNQELCIIEAMKMQNILRAPSSGKVEKIFVSQDQIVSNGEKLIQIQLT